MFILLIYSSCIYGQNKTAYFASGCFWCVEAIFESIDGVEDAIAGYAGGEVKNPSYKLVSSGKTNHAEAVKVIYNPNKVSYAQLVKAYFDPHDPTTKGQYPDFGNAYRSIVFYSNKEEKKIIDTQYQYLNENIYKGKMITEVKDLMFFIGQRNTTKILRKNPNNSYILRNQIKD